MGERADSTTTGQSSRVRSDHHCFGCGDLNPIGLHLRFTPRAGGVQAAFLPATEHQGFDNIVHGGIISAILDEGMAWATAYAGIWAVTGEIRVRFREPLHVGESTTATARITGRRGRTVTTSAEITRENDGGTVATATATFVEVGQDVQEAWKARYLVPTDGAGAADTGLIAGRDDARAAGEDDL